MLPFLAVAGFLVGAAGFLKDACSEPPATTAAVVAALREEARRASAGGGSGGSTPRERLSPRGSPRTSPRLLMMQLASPRLRLSSPRLMQLGSPRAA
jgi:hypothetical protein